MQVNTYLFGQIEVDEANVFTFPQGLTGFPGSTRFTLVHEDAVGQGAESYTLQSVDEPHVALQIVDPSVLGFDYQLELSEEEAAGIKLENPEDIAVMIIVYREEGEKTKQLGAATLAPLLLNLKSRYGLQKVIRRPRANVTLTDLAASA